MRSFVNTESKTAKTRGQRKTQDPCEGCAMHRDRCFCAQIARIETKSKLSLVIHSKELKRATNTGSLAVKALVNSEIFVRGRIGEDLDLSGLESPEYRTVLLYPSDDAAELTPEFVAESDLPIHLVVPDGNWRQASKVHHRHEEIRHLPRVIIQGIDTGDKHLRAEHTEYGMATLQAIAHAFGIIEGAEAKRALLDLYELKLHRTLLGRG